MFTDRKPIFLIGGLNFASCSAKASASISEVGEMRKTQGLPEVVMRAADDVSTSSGTLYSISFGMIARVKVLDQAPISTGTLSLSTSFSTEATASRGLDLLSSRISWIGRPSTPPARFSTSVAIFAPLAT